MFAVSSRCESGQGLPATSSEVSVSVRDSGGVTRPSNRGADDIRSSSKDASLLRRLPLPSCHGAEACRLRPRDVNRVWVHEQRFAHRKRLAVSSGCRMLQCKRNAHIPDSSLNMARREELRRCGRGWASRNRVTSFRVVDFAGWPQLSCFQRFNCAEMITAFCGSRAPFR